MHPRYLLVAALVVSLGCSTTQRQANGTYKTHYKGAHAATETLKFAIGLVVVGAAGAASAYADSPSYNSHSNNNEDSANGLGRSISNSYPAPQGEVYVDGYTRSDGTYVEPYMRTAPDDTTLNNWSTRGNVNPYTGEPGTKSP
jgi:hypothetical protein